MLRVFSFIRNKYLVAFLVIVFLGLLFEYNYFNVFDTKEFSEAFNASLHEKQEMIDELVDDIAPKLNNDFDKWMREESQEISEELTENEIALVIYEDEKLIYWSDNEVVVDDDRYLAWHNSGMIEMGNSWYFTEKQQIGNYLYGKLILIKSEYSYQNQFLRNHYAVGFPSSYNGVIVFNESASVDAIFDKSGNYLFSLSGHQKIKTESNTTLAIVSYFLAIIVLMLLFNSWFTKLLSVSNKGRISFYYILLLVAVRWLIAIFEVPVVFYESELFEPYYFGLSMFAPSLGDLFLSSIFVLAYIYFISSNALIQLIDLSKIKKELLVALALFIFIGAYLGVDFMMHSLLNDSTLNFEANRIFDISVYSIIGFFSIGFIILAFLLLVDEIVRSIQNKVRFIRFLLLLMLSALLIFVLLGAFTTSLNLYHLVVFPLLIGPVAYIRMSSKTFQYSTRIMILMVASLYTMLSILTVGEQKETEIKEIFALNLATEQDYLAEAFLLNVEKELPLDNYLIQDLGDGTNNLDLIYSYLQKKYFSGYWNKYEFNLFYCNEFDSITIEPEDFSVPCYDFFDSMIDESGFAVTDSCFYFIDDSNGRITYMGRIDLSDSLQRKVMYIELNSKITSSELGYPELLIEGKPVDKISPLGFSYAKYLNGNLITAAGEYQYSLTPDLYRTNGEEFGTMQFDGWEHLVYHVDEKNVIVVSHLSYSLLDQLILLSYLFVFYHILFTISITIITFPQQLLDFRLNIKNKIQFSMISVVLLSMVLIGGGTIYFNIKQFNNKHLDNLSEKVQSVMVELEHKLAGEEQLDHEIEEYLNYYLIKFSNVFFSDINVYALDGNLLASSRQEIFDHDLTSESMNTEAYRQMHYLKKANYVHNESIGQLEFLSAYVPFKNDNNQVLAYLNLPYFTKQSLLTKEISGLVTAVANIYVLLILLTILITVLISNKITRPLRLIQEKLSRLKLGEQNEIIEYHREDEIGKLIGDYNRMVNELSKSAELLAKSERESAWREMAKQIAHEIKNPLTPMRLHIQHLQKSIEDKAPDWDERFHKVSEILISQIDNLTSIATQFSKFSNIPKANNEIVDLRLMMKEIELLFQKNENYELLLLLEVDGSIEVKGNKEQMQSVLINLVKNAIQSIPENRFGRIELALSKVDESTVQLKVSDNGKGVLPAMRDKLFQPNFTTKTSGMGLGLAIVKNIVESMEGQIYFETELEKGTSFFVEIPLLK